MKIEIIVDEFDKFMEQKINNFIKNKQVIDIKFIPSETSCIKHALIMYEEKNNECNEEEKLKAEYTRGFMDERTTWQDKIKKEIELHEKNIISWGRIQDYRDNVVDIAIKQENYVIETLNKFLVKE